MTLTYAEENYVKAILKLSAQTESYARTNDLAAILANNPASVTDMLKKLSGRKLIAYEPYKGARLTNTGYKHATFLIRKHRLWKVFLYQSLNIPWEAVQEIAEELEHIKSALLLDHLDAFLGYPKFDPQGDPIPNAQGKYTLRAQTPLSTLPPGKSGLILGFKDQDHTFLKYLEGKGIQTGNTITILRQDPFDHNLTLSSDQKEITISEKAADHILIRPL